MDNLWAPWRLDYVQQVNEKRPGCFLCNAWRETGQEAQTLLLARGDSCFVIINRYPYANGHLMIVPARHIGNMELVETAEAAEMWRLAVLCKKILAEKFSAQGFNVGINQGKCGGAGVRDHLHMHIVPRWDGDTNFMPVIADTKVIPQMLKQVYKALRPAFAQHDL